MIISGCKKIVGGSGEGKALVSSQPINFLAMIDAKNGMVIDQKHELHGKSLKDIILVFPNAIGSSVGAYVFYSLKESSAAPKAVVCTKADITTASGCAIAKIPMVYLPRKIQIPTMSYVRVEADLGKIIITV